jgi:small-conductance mechanosensitive channel
MPAAAACLCRQFLARPFVPGDSVTLGGAGTGLTGIVESITPMRTTLRTEDDILVTVPNKVGHSNRSAVAAASDSKC